jgi:hypothetical protein
MEMPKPTDAHRKMSILTGKWTGEEKLHPSPWDPKGGSAIGRSENRLALDGFALLHDYTQERNGAVTFSGHGVLTFDSKEQCYVMHWWDSMGCGVNVFKGSFEGNTLNMSRNEARGQGRIIWEFPSANSHRFRMDFSQDGNQWQPFMEGEYKRTS